MECLHENIPMLYIKIDLCFKFSNGEIKCIYDVIYVLNLKRNFLSIGRIIDESIITLFNFDVYLIVTQSKSPIVVAKGFRDKSTSLYIFSPKCKKG
jgi:hypothetical protein